MIEKLQIYKDSYLLTGKLYQAMPQMDKMHRHVIGARILDCSLDVFKWISLANQSRDKAERIRYLDSFMSSFEHIGEFVSMLNSYLGFMKHAESYNVRKRLVQEIGQMWFKYIYISAHYYKAVIKKGYRQGNIVRDRINEEYNKHKIQRNGRFTEAY